MINGIQGAFARPACRGRRTGQAGQALAELAVLVSVLALVAAFAVDGWTLLHNQLSIAYAARQAARIGAEETQQPGADCAVLGAILAATTELADAQVTKIIIFQADPVGQSTGNQQVYAGNPGCPAPPTPPSGALVFGNWPSSLRVNAPPNEDTLGVEIDYLDQPQTGLVVTGPLLFSDQSTVRLAPLVGIGGAR